MTTPPAWTQGRTVGYRHDATSSASAASRAVGEVDPAKIGLQVEETVVGEKGVDEAVPLLELGELAHPLEMRGPLRVEVLLRGDGRA